MPDIKIAADKSAKAARKSAKAARKEAKRQTKRMARRLCKALPKLIRAERLIRMINAGGGNFIEYFTQHPGDFRKSVKIENVERFQHVLNKAHGLR